MEVNNRKVFLGVGHGGNDSGAVGYLIEKEVNLNMALSCRDYLTSRGVEVKMSRNIDENDSLEEEIRECNEYNPNLAVDIHNNAGGGEGCEVYRHHLEGKSHVMADNIIAELEAIGQKSRGVKIKMNSKGTADYFGFIRQIKAPSVIVESVFVDNKADAEKADTLDEQKKFGEAIAKGILKTLNVEDKPIQEIKKQKIKTVKLSNVNNTICLREKPTTNAKVVEYFKNNTTVIVLEENCANANGYNWDYVQIRVLPQYKGYMANTYLK